VQEWVATLEDMEGDARRASLAYVAGLQVDIPEEELNEALRRALVVRAVGGNPQRELRLDEEAVTRFAEELDGVERRRALQEALEALRVHVHDHPAAESLEELLADGDLAWRCFAAANVAAELG
jgi:hypothetical protein